jgi:hypothetical protein
MPLKRHLHNVSLRVGSKGQPIIDGYAAAAIWTAPAGSSISALKATWQVPDPPAADSGQIIYLFIGMETAGPVGDRTILQPVLQWGANDRKQWSVASYCVSGSPGNLKFAATSKAVLVSPGERLSASITLKKTPEGASYLSQFERIPETVLYVRLPQALSQAGIALEAQNVMQLSRSRAKGSSSEIY